MYRLCLMPLKIVFDATLTDTVYRSFEMRCILQR